MNFHPGSSNQTKCFCLQIKRLILFKVYDITSSLEPLTFYSYPIKWKIIQRWKKNESHSVGKKGIPFRHFIKPPNLSSVICKLLFQCRKVKLLMHRSAEHIERSIQTQTNLLEFWLSSVCESLKNTRKKIMTFDRRTFDRRIQPPP